MLELYAKHKEAADSDINGESYVGKRFAKFFRDEVSKQSAIFFGTIRSYDSSNKFWHVVYDDNDSDDNDKRELAMGLKLYEENKITDPKRHL